MRAPQNPVVEKKVISDGMIDPSFIAILLGFFFIVCVAGYLLFDVIGLVLGAIFYLGGCVYSVVCSKKKIGIFRDEWKEKK